MKKNSVRFYILAFLLAGSAAVCCISAKQGPGNLQNTNNSGIPNSGNTIPNNNGPESPHTSFPIQSTSPGPLLNGPSYDSLNYLPDTASPHR